MEPSLHKSIYEYPDYRSLIKDYYERKKACQPCFSLSTLGNKVGMSKVSIKNIIDGKRHLADDNIDLFAKQLGLKGDQATYFKHLALFNKAKTAKARERHFLAMMQCRKSPYADSYLNASRMGYFQEWYYPAFAELSYVAGFRTDPAWIKARLLFPVSIERITKALSYLKNGGWLQGGGPAPAKLKTDVPSHGLL